MGYPAFAAISGGFGYWLSGVEERQRAFLEKRKQSLLEKRARAANTSAVERGLAEGRGVVVA